MMSENVTNFYFVRRKTTFRRLKLHFPHSHHSEMISYHLETISYDVKMISYDV